MKSRIIAIVVIFLSALGIIFPSQSYAHCPLCTAGAGTLAVLAVSLGVSTASVGVFIGGFAVAMGLWLARLIRKNFFRGQKWLVVIASFVLTVWPLVPLLTHKYGSFYISWGGDYGGIFNRTYVWNWFVVASVIGGMLMAVSPLVSGFLRGLRQGKIFPYQGMIIAFVFLVAAALIFQFTT